MSKFNKLKFISLSFLIASVALISTLVIKKYKRNLKEFNKPEIKNDYIEVKITGAILYPGFYTLKNKSNLNDLLIKAQLLSFADLKDFNKAEILKNKQEIHIPFLNNFKILISNINNVQILKAMDISSSIANKIFLLIKQKRNNITWNDISEIPLVGEKTLDKLKNHIIL
ncbi:MAG0490 family ComEA-like DNA-binding protein [Mycoplasma struthionis]|uniref:Soluble ligand binding domain-containing protein n=1 Tax=Mycoplasma struthionis TaxID=538220 RepID=A0A502M8M5_9MOLU|nr:hypothetical protein [Mycoplasma struthionis]TPI01496.1 hypothetical protein FJM01_02510 [Mycoplasma struthionis]